jgi:hypothetical protein
MCEPDWVLAAACAQLISVAGVSYVKSTDKAFVLRRYGCCCAVFANLFLVAWQHTRQTDH